MLYDRHNEHRVILFICNKILLLIYIIIIIIITTVVVIVKNVMSIKKVAESMILDKIE